MTTPTEKTMTGEEGKMMRLIRIMIPGKEHVSHHVLTSNLKISQHAAGKILFSLESKGIIARKTFQDRRYSWRIV